ncbi:RND family efflux transporter MFP subunit [Sphingomonas zeicaulis]|uniref:efflux RND transporter periplasmic adaptor subunit n=1 Tax=Sphingomonas zeicaulis TaxID=1632740 RepID=UPI003D205313
MRHGSVSKAARIAALALGVALAGCSASEPPPPPPPLPVEVARVTPSSGAALHAAGTIAWERESVLSFRVPGMIMLMNAQIGDRVGAGATLAALDATDVAARLRQAKEDVARARRTAARYAALAETGAMAPAQARDQQTVTAQAEAALLAARYDHRSTRLTAPFGGIVLARVAQRGEVVSPGQEVLRVADLSSPLLARAAVPAHDVSGLRAGTPATVTIGARAVSGRVLRIGSQADARTGTVIVEVALAERNGLASGTVVDVAFADVAAAGEAATIRVPAEAVLEAGGGRATLFLFDAPRSRAMRKAVRFIGYDGDDALVAGLPANATVITAGAGYVRDGQRVMVSNR